MRGVGGVERPARLLDSCLRKEDPGHASAAEVLPELLRACVPKAAETARSMA